MGLFSILPNEYAIVETWLKRIFVRLARLQSNTLLIATAQLLMGIIAIGPWVFLLIYDLIYYLVRSMTYEIPLVGGRARGKARPRAPSLTERPSGHRRRFSLARRRDPPAHGSGDHKPNGSDPRWRNMRETGF